MGSLFPYLNTKNTRSGTVDEKGFMTGMFETTMVRHYGKIVEVLCCLDCEVQPFVLLANWERHKTWHKIKGNSQDAPVCSHCGTIMQRAGACYSCPECGETSGCS